MARTTDALIAVAAKEVGYNRYDDPEQGTKYGRWYAKLTSSPYFGTTGVPYCAMFVSWCLYQLGITCTGCPTAACTSGLLRAARSAGKLLKCSDLKKGDLILFNWTSAGYYAAEADHVGIVVANHGTYLDTIEGNVSGCVKRCTRYPSNVVGGIRPQFEAEKQLKALPLVKKGDRGDAVTALQLLLQLRGVVKFGVIDGIFGDKTEKSVKEFQQLRGIYPDGMVGAKTWPALTAK